MARSRRPAAVAGSQEAIRPSCQLRVDRSRQRGHAPPGHPGHPRVQAPGQVSLQVEEPQQRAGPAHHRARRGDAAPRALPQHEGSHLRAVEAGQVLLDRLGQPAEEQPGDPLPQPDRAGRTSPRSPAR